MTKFDPSEMRARFRVLHAQREAIRAKAAPLRQARDAVEAEARAKCAQMDTEIAKAEDNLLAIKEEMAVLSRALNGKT